MRSMKTRLGAVLAVLTLAAALTSSPAWATHVAGSSSAFGASVSGIATLAPTPTASNTLPGSGNSNSAASVSVSGPGPVGPPLLTTGVLNVSAGPLGGGDPTGTFAHADVSSTSALAGSATPVTAGAIDLDCTATPTALAADLVVTNLMIGTLAINGTVAANTVVVDTPALRIVLNEQIISAGSITANGLHITVFGANAVDIIVTSVTCAASVGTPVTLRSLTASPSKSGVVVRWRTASELGLVGYNVYREKAGKRVRVNKRLIAARSSHGAGSYVFVDRSARSGRYWLQAVNLDGSRSFLASARLAR